MQRLLPTVLGLKCHRCWIAYRRTPLHRVLTFVTRLQILWRSRVVKFRSRRTGSADFIRSVADVRLAAVKLQHAWQGLTPWVAGTWCFPSLVLMAHSKVSPHRRNHAKQCQATRLNPNLLHGHSRVPFRCLLLLLRPHVCRPQKPLPWNGSTAPA
jgi:hypothetical protein